MRIEVRGRNVEVTDELREHVDKRFARIGRQVSELAQLEVELREERNPSISDRYVAEATLYLKGVTLRAREASPGDAALDPRARRGHPPPGQAPSREAPRARQRPAARSAACAAARRSARSRAAPIRTATLSR